jgi:thioesterase domain-containing protein
VSSAGGSLGAYARFARALDSPRPVVGLEDPYLSGRRSLGASFGQWVGHFVDMIRHRQDAGPYHICAYSSAGAFGWEIVRRLEGAGAEVAALVLIDPMSLDSRRRTRWGWWAARCSYAHPVVRWGARIAGRLRSPLSRAAARVVGEGAARDDLMPRGREAEAMGEEALQNASLLRRLACLMELDTGVPLPSVEAPDAAPDPPPPFARFRTAVTTAHPQADPDRLERMVRQYGVQVQCQRGYALRPVAAPVFIFEPESGYAGLLEGLVRPFAGSLQAFRVPVGTPSPRQQELLEGFQGWRPHYWCMRDETFAAGVAAEVDRLLA